MKLNVQELKKVLNVIRGSVSNEIDLYGHILLETMGKNRTMLYATDQMSFSVVRMASTNEKPMKVLIPYTDFRRYVGLWSTTLSLSVTQNTVTIKSGKDSIKLSTGQGQKGFKDGFPQMNHPPDAVKVSSFPSMVSTAYRVLDTRTRINNALRGVHVLIKNSILTVEASDGFQLVSMWDGVSNPKSLDSVINSDGVKLLSALPHPGKLWVEGGLIFYGCSLGVFAVRLLDVDDYPDLGKFLPKRKRGQLVIDKKVMANLVRKINYTRTNRMELNFTDSNVVYVEAKSIGQENQIEYRGREVPKSINGHLPQDVVLDTHHIDFLLSLGGDDCAISFGEPNKPVWYRDSNFVWASIPYMGVK